MPFHHTSGWKYNPIVDVNGIHQPSVDRFAHTLDCDATFQGHT
jgi:hypothetical protein